METIVFDLNYLGESSQQQLDAYRNIGSVRTLRRLKAQEIRRKKRIKRILWALKNLVLGACLAFDLWVLISWIDIVADNTTLNPVHHAWNFFVLLF